MKQNLMKVVTEDGNLIKRNGIRETRGKRFVNLSMKTVLKDHDHKT
jgi:hypothetical protein